MKSIYMAFFLAFSAMVSAQNKLSGLIVDKNNKPITGANIALPEIHKETQTDANGNYILSSIPNGNFRVVVSFIGYATQTKTVAFSGETVRLPITLEEAEVHMDEVIVSTVFNKLQSQNVMKVEHHSTKELQQKGATTLIEGLATIPGVSQVSTGVSIGKPVIRGLSGNRVLVYTQGVRLENQQFGEEHGLGLNDAGVESVEVIKGPASLLYGSDALGGVLYFNPEKFALPHAIKGNFSQKFFTNTHGSSTNFGVNAANEKWKFLTRIKHDLHADYKTPDSNRVTNTRYNETDFKTAIGFSQTKFSGTLRYNLNQLNLGIPEEGFAIQTTDRKPDYPRQGVKSHILSWNNFIYLNRSKIEANVGYIANNRSEFEDSPSPILNMKLNTLNYDAKYYLPTLGKIESIVGVQGMHQTNENFGFERLIPDAKVNDFGVFVTALTEFQKNTFQAGLRFDNRKVTTETFGNEGEEGYFHAVDKSFNSFNASLGFKSNSFENLIFRLNVASGFRAPNLAELTSNGVHEGSNRYEIGNATLKNEQNLQTDVNIEFKSTHFEFFVNGFYNHINNYIFIQPTGDVLDENDVYRYVQDNAQLFGGEAGIHFHPHPLDWLHFTSSFESVTGRRSNSEYLPLIPANKINSTLRAELKDGKLFQNNFALLSMDYFLPQNNLGQFETKTNDYALLNVALGGKIAFTKVGIEWSLNANNLLDRNYISHLSRLKTDGIPNMGRNIIFGLNISI